MDVQPFGHAKSATVKRLSPSEDTHGVNDRVKTFWNPYARTRTLLIDFEYLITVVHATHNKNIKTIKKRNSWRFRVCDIGVCIHIIRCSGVRLVLFCTLRVAEQNVENRTEREERTKKRG